MQKKMVSIKKEEVKQMSQEATDKKAFFIMKSQMTKMVDILQGDRPQDIMNKLDEQCIRQAINLVHNKDADRS